MPYLTVIKIGEQILEASEVKFMSLPPHVFDVDHAAKIRSWLSITVLEKKPLKITAQKSDLRDLMLEVKVSFHL